MVDASYVCQLLCDWPWGGTSVHVAKVVGATSSGDL